MELFIVVLLICFLIFLFCLYLLVNDDFVLLRKDISTERIFNIAFLVALFSLITARLMFVAINPSSKFLNPLVFLAIPYFPGLSLTGGVVGGVVAFFALAKKDGKMPITRLFDFFSISMLSALPIGFLGYFLLSNQLVSVYAISTIILYSVLFIVFIKFLLPKLLSRQLQEGSIGLLFLISFSLISLSEHFIGRLGGGIYFNLEDLILLSFFVVSGTMLIKSENLLTKFRKHGETKKP